MSMKTASVALAVLLSLSPLVARQTGFIEGRIVDKDTKDPLPATILSDDGQVCSADIHGLFKLPVRITPGRTVKITAWLIGFKKKTVEAKPGEFLTIALEIEPIAAQEISVTADSIVSDDRIKNTITLTKMETYTLPGTAADPLYASHVLPGVNSPPDASSLLIRGGAADEVGYYFDGIEIRHPFLSESLNEGYFSIFDNQVVEKFNVSTSGFHPKYGDALSGIMNIEAKDAPAKGEGGLGLSILGLTSYIGMPVKGVGGFVASFDQSFSEWMNRLNGREDSDFGNGQMFGKFNLRLGGSGEIRLYGMSDSYRMTEKESFDIHSVNTMTGISWTSAWSKNLVTKAVVAGTGYDLTFESADSYRVRSRDNAIQARMDVIWDLGRHNLEFGADLDDRRLTTDLRTDVSSAYRVRGVRKGFYVSDKFRLTGRWYMDAGVRASSLDLLGRRWDFDPRASLAFLLTRKDIFRFSAGLYHQFGDYYVLNKNRGLAPKSAFHASLSYDRIADALELRATLYDKEYRNLFLNGAGGEYGDVTNGGRGYSRGGEFFIKIKDKRYEVLLVYNALRSRRMENDVPALSPSPYEIAHSVTAIIEKKFEKGNVGLRFSFATGRPYTPLEGRTWDDATQAFSPIWGAAYSARYQSYERLDLNGNYNLKIFKKSVVFYFGVTNLLNNRNVLGFNYDEKYTAPKEQSSIFSRTIFVGAYVPFF